MARRTITINGALARAVVFILDGIKGILALASWLCILLVIFAIVGAL